MQTPQSTEILIIGAGLAGLSTALHLEGRRDFHIVESGDVVGGKALTEHRDGYAFDITGHWLHLRDAGIQQLVYRLLGEDHFTRVQRISRIWSHGVYTLYPYQANIHGLPPDVVHECLMGAIEADRSLPDHIEEADEPENFADWIKFYFGEGIAKHFMVPYNAKLWGVPATEITSRWCQRFVPRPRLSDIVAGAVGMNREGMGYNASFIYPKAGGIHSLSDALADAVGHEHISLNTTVKHVDLTEKIATFTDGRQIKFERLVSSMPLPYLIDQLTPVAPQAVVDARHQLRWTATPYFNVGIKGPVKQPDHWIYVPEHEWPMYRVGVFTNAIPEMAPEGCHSLYVEMADRETPLEQLADRVAEGLVAMQLIDSVDQIEFMWPRHIGCAYVVYDHAYHGARETIHSWLHETGTLSIGRYGEWKYCSMEDAMIDGRAAAEQLLADQNGASSI
ncbi:MAG: protoporphyrinogen/coproporphyrinogen oxidase [Bradymonadia bacterium]